jgi:hypothetical protein
MLVRPTNSRRTSSNRKTIRDSEGQAGAIARRLRPGQPLRVPAHWPTTGRYQLSRKEQYGRTDVLPRPAKTRVGGGGTIGESIDSGRESSREDDFGAQPRHDALSEAESSQCLALPDRPVDPEHAHWLICVSVPEACHSKVIVVRKSLPQPGFNLAPPFESDDPHIAVIAVAAAGVGHEGGERLPEVVRIEGVDELDRDRHLLRLARGQTVRGWGRRPTRTLRGGDGGGRKKPDRANC